MFDPKAQLKELVMDKKYLIYAGLFLLGVVLAPKVRPMLTKIPVVGSKIPA